MDKGFIRAEFQKKLVRGLGERGGREGKEAKKEECRHSPVEAALAQSPGALGGVGCTFQSVST